ncbi:MAG: signal peptidase I [Oscillospiraceae bacterium]
MYTPETRAQSFRLAVYSWLQPLLFALVFLILLSTFAGRIIGVDGSSMFPTLHDHDMLVLQSLAYKPAQGDIVVLTQRSFSDKPIVKRVIATGGQTVDVNYDDNTVTVTDPDGTRTVLDEPYLGEPMHRPGSPTNDHIEVPEGSICVFGDNRNNSTDSRSPSVGTADERCVLGRAVLRILPLHRFGVL